MEFKNPYFFALLALLIPYIIWYVLRNKKSQPAMRMPQTAKYRYVPRTWRNHLMPLPFLLRIILFTLVVCILARPQSKHSWNDTDVEGIDIMLAVDFSTSMLAQDFKPNRVEALKEIAQDFISKRPNDNIGLTFFAGEAYTQCPLTTDHTVLMNLYSSADSYMAYNNKSIEDGTAIGDGIMNALLRLRESQAKSTFSPTVSTTRVTFRLLQLPRLPNSRRCASTPSVLVATVWLPTHLTRAVPSCSPSRLMSKP